MRRLRFRLLLQPLFRHRRLILNERDELLVCRRAKEPAKGTLDLPGGFIDMTETGEEGVAREVREETGMKVAKAEYLFSLPNITSIPASPYTRWICFPLYGGGHLALRGDGRRGRPLLPPLKRYPYGRVRLGSIRKGVGIFLEDMRKNKSE